MARCGRAPDCPPEGCWAEDCCVTQDSQENYTMRVWCQLDGWHWSVTGVGVDPCGGVAGALVEAGQRVADCSPVFAALASEHDAHAAEAEVERLRGERDGLRRELERLQEAANSARVLLERHRATRGSTDLLTTALRELDGVLPPVAATQQKREPEEGTR